MVGSWPYQKNINDKPQAYYEQFVNCVGKKFYKVGPAAVCLQSSLENQTAGDSSTVAEHLPRRPKVYGSSPAPFTGTMI
jgi:hypothetical protein